MCATYTIRTKIFPYVGIALAFLARIAERFGRGIGGA